MKSVRNSRISTLAAVDGPNSQTLFVAYYRVSTDRQSVSSLGLDAQRASVAAFVGNSGGRIIHEMEEIESGKRSNRPVLAEALELCRLEKATLIVAKIDRLARNTRFLLSIAEGAADNGVVFCDLPLLPTGPMGKFFLTLMAAVAELEAGLISERTKSALAAAKARGKRLGNPNLRAVGGPATRKRIARATAREILPYIRAARKAGCKTLTSVAEALQARGVATPNGKTQWTAEQVRRIEAHAAQL